ncbi:CocE/NonD family hydrolase [Spongiactinospora sp. 9N601]|uniref:CocE/NonD family hydrolase n=1 Tax=Spongiactinospora sp. 9N601 TaxID=3375149 RepID=UPI003789AD1F
MSGAPEARPGPVVAGMAAELVLPGRIPAAAVVIRTPYGIAGCLPEARSFAAAGLACLVQDVRGRHLSPGTFAIGRDETADGHATLDWAVAQPWCDGTVFLYGVAYEAYAAWCAAGHPAVGGIISRQPWPPIAAPALDDELWWRTELARPGLFEEIMAGRPEPDVAGWPVDIGPWPPAPGGHREAIARVTRAAREVTAPSLHLGSWLCRSAETTVRQAALAPGTDVVMGGWASALTHRLHETCALDVPVEPHPFELALDWLAGRRQGRCLLLGSGRWTDADPLPPRRTGQAAPAVESGPVRLRHDPARPYPSAPHSADLAPLADRPDVVRLSVPDPPPWHGTPLVTAEVSTDVPAELVATLVHERPGGVATRLADGTAPVRPGVTGCEIRLTVGAVELPPGHRLHLELTAGRPPRHRAPGVPAEITLSGLALHLPRPRGGAFPEAGAGAAL